MRKAKQTGATIECGSCGLEMWDDERGQAEMEIHEAECDGWNDAVARFGQGDAVVYSNLGMKRLDTRPDEGVIAGFGDEPNLVRVQWHSRVTTETLAHHFVKHADHDQ